MSANQMHRIVRLLAVAVGHGPAPLHPSLLLLPKQSSAFSVPCPLYRGHHTCSLLAPAPPALGALQQASTSSQQLSSASAPLLSDLQPLESNPWLQRYPAEESSKQRLKQLQSTPNSGGPARSPFAEACKAHLFQHRSQGCLLSTSQETRKSHLSQYPLQRHFHRSAPEAKLPCQSKGQRRLSSEIHTALSLILEQDQGLKESLVQRFGMAIHAVHLQQDRTRASVLWGCYPNMEHMCESVLQASWCNSRFRTKLSSRLKMRTPQLEFVHDALNAGQEKVLAVVEQVEREGEQEKIAGCGAGIKLPVDIRNVEQAVERLQADVESRSRPQHRGKRGW